MKKKKVEKEKDKTLSTNTKNSLQKHQKKKVNKKKFGKNSSVSVVPQSASQFSSNWKKFLENEKSKPTKKQDQKVNGVKRKIVTGSTTAAAGSEGHSKRLKTKSVKEKEIESNPIWFDDVDPLLLEQECGIKRTSDKTSIGSNETGEKTASATAPKLDDETVFSDADKLTKYVALDCEMVGIGFEGKENALARVSLVNSNCECIYDKFVKPLEKVVDYRTAFSGVRPSDLVNAPSYEVVQKEVADILDGRVLVGHALHNDLKCLMLGHSWKQIRDTSKYKPFHKLLGTKRPALRKLVAKVLGETIQSGEHSSVVDARVTMKIFKLYRKEWESFRVKKRGTGEKTSEIFMGTEEKKSQKNNKWKKIKQRKKLKE